MVDDNDDRGAFARDEYSYEAFGRDFFEHAITCSRIEQSLADLTGNRIDFGPRPAGPGGLARVTAVGELGEVVVHQREYARIVFEVMVPARLVLGVRLMGRTHHFDADLRAILRLTARAIRPLRIHIDVEPPAASDVQVDVAARGFGARVLDSVSDVKGELRRFVAHYIESEIDSPPIRRLRDIDVAERLEASWAH